MWYSPDEVELYLIDFKKGVEFKTYATHSLPHARAIAVESDREFGLSVLQRLDAELTPPRRPVPQARRAGPGQLPPGARRQPMPRTLLMIDEFQEFFSEDDKLAQEASLLLDRLVRQGRAFGIHVLLGSQTIGGSSGLARSTIGQMAVRIALQTSEADSQLILGDGNSAARLLSRPGEAIYNDAGGLVEANSPFQVAWLPDEKRERIPRAGPRPKAQVVQRPVTSAPIVFEGNAPADDRARTPAPASCSSDPTPGPDPPPRPWRGSAIRWRSRTPTAVAFRRQSGANMLIIGQQEEAAMAMAAAVGDQRWRPSTRRAARRSTCSTAARRTRRWRGCCRRSRPRLPHDVKLVDYRAVPEAMDELAAELEKRQAGDGTDRARNVRLHLRPAAVPRAPQEEESFSFSMERRGEEGRPRQAVRRPAPRRPAAGHARHRLDRHAGQRRAHAGPRRRCASSTTASCSR